MYYNFFGSNTFLVGLAVQCEDGDTGIEYFRSISPYSSVESSTISLPQWPLPQSAFFAISPEDLPRTTFAKTIDSIVEPLFSPTHFPAQKTASAVWPLLNSVELGTERFGTWYCSYGTMVHFTFHHPLQKIRKLFKRKTFH